jgi:phosphoribosylaminoimidazolecarboxamide formyltransferase/IMP cyclohydrolase
MNAKVGLESFKQIWGKEISFNNLLDEDSCVQMLLDFGPEHHVCCILKHTSPNGVAIDFKSQLEAAKRALSCDPLSAFGGIFGFNHKLEKETAHFLINEKKMFIEVMIAPEYDEEALKILKTKENMRIIQMKNMFEMKSEFYARPELRCVLGGMLVEDYDCGPVLSNGMKKPNEKPPKMRKMHLYLHIRYANGLKVTLLLLQKNMRLAFIHSELVRVSKVGFML